MSSYSPNTDQSFSAQSQAVHSVVQARRRRATLIEADTLSNAWLETYRHLISLGGKDVNVMVVMPGTSAESLGIRRALDAVLPEGYVDTVAGTIFPQPFYHPDKLLDTAAEHVFDEYELAYPLLRKYQGNSRGTYFGRMTQWSNGTTQPINQLAVIIKKLQRAHDLTSPKSSIYEIAVADAAENTELRIQHPGDGSEMGFPCLSHISLTLKDGVLHMSALYRNQHFIDRAYGNYLGLSHLMQFLCTESSCTPGDIACWATHADAQLDKIRIGKARELIAECDAYPSDAYEE